MRGWLERVEGLKGVREGVARALRFWVIGSSIVARERRRKSVDVEDVSFWPVEERVRLWDREEGKCTPKSILGEAELR